MAEFVAFKSKKINSDYSSEANLPAASAPIWKFPEHIPIHRLHAALVEYQMPLMAKAQRRRPGAVADGKAIVSAKLLAEPPEGMKRRKIGRRAVLVHHALTDMGAEASVEDIAAHLALKPYRSDGDAALSHDNICKALGALVRAGFAEVQWGDAVQPFAADDDAADCDADDGYRVERNSLTAVHRQVLLTLIRLSSRGRKIKKPIAEIADAAGLTVPQTRGALVALARVRPYALISVEAEPGRVLVITLRGFNIDKVRAHAKKMSDVQVAAINGALLSRQIEPSLRPQEYVTLVALACGATVREDGSVATTVTVEALRKPIWRRGKCISDPLLGWDERHIERTIASLCNAPEPLPPSKRADKSPMPTPLSKPLVRQLPLKRETEAERKIPNTYIIDPAIIEVGKTAMKTAASKSKRKAARDQRVDCTHRKVTPYMQTGGAERNKSTLTPATQTGGAGTSGYPSHAHRDLLEGEGDIADGHLALVLSDASAPTSGDGFSAPSDLPLGAEAIGRDGDDFFADVSDFALPRAALAELVVDGKMRSDRPSMSPADRATGLGAPIAEVQAPNSARRPDGHVPIRSIGEGLLRLMRRT